MGIFISMSGRKRGDNVSSSVKRASCLTHRTVRVCVYSDGVLTQCPSHSGQPARARY